MRSTTKAAIPPAMPPAMAPILGLFTATIGLGEEEEAMVREEDEAAEGKEDIGGEEGSPEVVAVEFGWVSRNEEGSYVR